VTGSAAKTSGRSNGPTGDWRSGITGLPEAHLRTTGTAGNTTATSTQPPSTAATPILTPPAAPLGPCTYFLRTGTRSGEVCGLPHTTQCCFGRLTDAWRTQFPDAVELPRWHDLLLQNVPIFDIDFDAILAAMYALADITEGDCYLRVPPDPGTVGAALGASAAAALGASASAAPSAVRQGPVVEAAAGAAAEPAAAVAVATAVAAATAAVATTSAAATGAAATTAIAATVADAATGAATTTAAVAAAAATGAAATAAAAAAAAAIATSKWHASMGPVKAAVYQRVRWGVVSESALAALHAAPSGPLAAPAALLAAPCGPLTAPCSCLPCALRCPASPRSACCATMASLQMLGFDHKGRPLQFDTWLDDLQLYLLRDSRDSVSLFDHTSGAAPAPPATADSATRSQWLTRNAAARLAICNHLQLAECAHFGQHRTTHALYDAVVARYSSPATAALGRLLLPYLFPELSAFATVEDLGPALSGVSQVDPLPGTVPVEVARDLGAARGTASGGAEPGGAESEGAGSGPA
ncbi:unnamed protein product, partial [Closterium sp. NIES-54]